MVMAKQVLVQPTAVWLVQRDGTQTEALHSWHTTTVIFSIESTPFPPPRKLKQKGYMLSVDRIFPRNPGDCLFYGQTEANTSMWQSVNLNAYTDISLIDGQTVHFNLSAWFGGFATHNDRVTVFLTFFDQGNQMVGNMSSIGPVTNNDRNNVTSFHFRQTAGLVPAGARSMTVYVVIERSIGPINDGYVDNISVSLYV